MPKVTIKVNEDCYYITSPSGSSITVSKDKIESIKTPKLKRLFSLFGTLESTGLMDKKGNISESILTIAEMKELLFISNN